ncbi:hypothetical protein LGT39_06300 [Demequina sp. TTPB684]|uniref:hypothetical protein n=1 Tax=unclassified Demequina TaxID=2620311 RepID=UPI001CF47AB3|nr:MULTISPECIES: hypothetical protein [unclassified Demequina]MCB2412460.1 hypothetical protein [Demequina sp. TTPB684]UPU87706.1 hypothetical protein LGT36_010645 [Demequina sp. TMPB413]
MSDQTLRLSALDVTREVDLMPRGIQPASDATQLKPGILLAVDTDTNRVQVSVDGSSGVWIPYLAGSYTVGDIVWVFRENLPGTSGMICLGRVGGTSEVGAPEVPDAPPTTEAAVATILPTWTGTWRVSRSAYDQWNASRAEYGGRATLYQGDAFGSGQLYGLALYGNQIKDLGAVSIESIALTLRDASLSLGSRPAMVVRAATNTNASAAPAATGATMNPAALAKGAVTTLALDGSLLESFRTGALQALATVGVGSSAYNAVRGTSDADGMALTVNYTRPV